MPSNFSVVPLARSIGYELESTAGAYASLTTKLSAEQSSTALEGIMRTLSNADVAMGKIDKKTGKYISGFRAVGINIFDSAGKIRPLIDIVKDLNKQMDGLTDAQKVEKLSKLGFDQSTALGFGTLMQDVQGLEKATTATYGSQNALNKAYMDSLTPMELSYLCPVLQTRSLVFMFHTTKIIIPCLFSKSQDRLILCNIQRRNCIS